MKLNEISLLLQNGSMSEHFSNSLKRELIEYRQNLSKKGTSAPINLIEDTTLPINYNEIKILCTLYFTEKLNYLELSYIADALLLSEKVFFLDDNCRCLVEEMTDSEINGVFTSKRADEIIMQIE